MPEIPNAAAKVILGFDFGLRNIGVAIGQSITGTASPVTTLLAQDGIPKWEEIEALIQHWKPDVLIVGVALNEDGSAQPITFSTRRFINRLRERYKLPVHEVDERLSSWQAQEHLENLPHKKIRSKKKVHAVAAVVLVEQYMQSKTS